MSTVDPKILAKIKKCLALASSSNPNEAATALRQAHALMEKHCVSAHEVTMADIGETSIPSKTMARDKPAHWETRLAALVGKAFGCQLIIKRAVMAKGYRGYFNEGNFVFIGLSQQAEIAAYTATVLIRKCKTARQQWLSTNYGGISRGVRGVKAKLTRMGDMFAEGWVDSIGKLVTDFANPPEIDAAIDRHIESQNMGSGDPTRKIEDKDIGKHEYFAAMSGAKAAQNESLYRPMDAAQGAPMLGFQSQIEA